MGLMTQLQKEQHISKELASRLAQQEEELKELRSEVSMTCQMFPPTSPVLGDPLLLLPVQPRLRDVCLKVTSPGVLWFPPSFSCP